jgi:hypothetical protein
MNWSAYSAYVGDVFGAPLAMEGLAAFFLESTFLGLWVFGWEVLPRGSTCCRRGWWPLGRCCRRRSSWPRTRGCSIRSATRRTRDGRPVLNSIGDLFGNPVFIWGYIHVILAALVTGAVVMLAVSAWQLRRGNRTFTTSALLSLVVLLPRRCCSWGRQPARGHRDDLPAHEDRRPPRPNGRRVSRARSRCSRSAASRAPTRSPSRSSRCRTLLSILATLVVGRRGRGPELNCKPRMRPEYGPGTTCLRSVPSTTRCASWPTGARFSSSSRSGASGMPRAETADIPGLPLDRRLAGAVAAHHEHRRAGADRERSTAVDRAGADEDGDGVSATVSPTEIVLSLVAFSRCTSS